MNYDYPHSSFSKSVLAGTFAGILAVCLCLIFNGFFREFGNVNFSELINVSTIIFALIILLAVVGLFYNVLVSKFAAGNIIYIVIAAIVFGLLTVGCFHVQRSPDAAMNLRYQYLLMGITIITGLCAVVAIPFFYKKDIL